MCLACISVSTYVWTCMHEWIYGNLRFQSLFFGKLLYQIETHTIYVICMHTLLMHIANACEPACVTDACVCGCVCVCMCVCLCVCVSVPVCLTCV